MGGQNWKPVHIYSSKTNFLHYLLQTRNFDSGFGHFLANHVVKIGLPWQ